MKVDLSESECSTSAPTKENIEPISVKTSGNPFFGLGLSWISFLYFKEIHFVAEEESIAFVDMEHSYCLPRSNSQEDVETEKPSLVSGFMDHDYASSPLSPPPVQTTPSKKTPLKDRNRIVNHHKVHEKDYIAEKK